METETGPVSETFTRFFVYRTMDKVHKPNDYDSDLFAFVHHGCTSRGPGFDSQRCQIFRVAVGLERGPLRPCDDKWGEN
jgi:hypothetical protein